MAKKIKNTSTPKEVVEAVVEQEVAEATMEYFTEPEEEQVEKNNTWEMKTRVYFLKNNLSPLSYRIPSRKIYYFDEEKGYEREMSYTRNQTTLFVDEFQGDARLAHIIFRDGTLTVPKNQQNLQKLLSLYHPLRGVLYQELNEERNATVEVDNIELELEAMNAAVGLDIDMAEAVMRAEIGSKVSSMSSKELKRDLLVFAKRNPNLFLDLMNDDNIHLRNVGIKATELGIVKLSGDNRTFSWGTNDRKLMTVPFDEHPYSALASWFKTDEGMEVLNSIEKRLG
tara:strand:- start:2891 stop:3739 length:849 start_codon:yes stop_codon:yes gene_type:complete